jgi:hypothetical protein
MSHALGIGALGKVPLAACAVLAFALLGMVRLSEGDREGARESFDKCVATRWVDLPIYPYAQIFLARMKHDPKWPRWIPAKK